LTYVEDFEVNSNYLEAKRMIEGGYEIVRVSLPVLLTITNTANTPRDTIFRDILRAIKHDLITWSANNINIDPAKIGLGGSPTKLKKIEKIVSPRKKYIVEGETFDEVLNNLLSRLDEQNITLGDGNGT
jgi:electron transfer flavoprotein beta subunit